MRIGIFHPAALEPVSFPILEQQIVRRLGKMPPFEEHRRPRLIREQPRSALHLRFITYAHSAKGLRLRQIRRDKLRHWEQLSLHPLHRFLVKQPVPTRGNHHRVDYDAFRLTMSQRLCHRLHNLGIAEHADFDRIGPDIPYHTVDLLDD